MEAILDRFGPMTTTGRRRITFVIGTVFLVQLVDWFIFSSMSPLASYFLWHPAAANLWTLVNLPGIYLGVLVSGNIHQPSPIGSILGVSLQWAMLAMALSLAVPPLRPKQTKG